MKFLCDGCERLVELAAYRLEREGPDTGSERLYLRCAKCGCESRASAPRDASVALAQVTTPMRVDPFEATTIPGFVVGEGEAEGEAKAPFAETPFSEPAPDAVLPTEVTMPPAGYCAKCIEPRAEGSGPCPKCGLTDEGYRPEALDPALGQQAATLWAAWDKVELHDALLFAAAAQGALPQVGRLYRIRLARHPGDEPARRGIAEVLRLASSAAAGHLSPSQGSELEPPRAQKPGLGLAVLGLFLVGLLLALGLLVGSFRGGG